MNKKHWTPEEERYLQEKWGIASIPAIAKHLDRSVNAVKLRASRLGLGAFRMGGEYVTLNQLHIAVTGSPGGSSYITKSWVKNRGLPVHTKTVVKHRFRVVYLEEFWKWAEKNKSFIDFSKMEPMALGKEPAWVAEQRKRDFQGYAIQRKDPWTAEDDSRLIMLLQQHKYGYAELSEMLLRSAGAIQRRCQDLGIKERPVKADNHSPSSKWTEHDFEILAEGIRNVECYTQIGRKLGRSEKAIRGKVYFVYLTEDADKIRAMCSTDNGIAAILLSLDISFAEDGREFTHLYCDGQNNCITEDDDITCTDEMRKACIVRWLSRPVQPVHLAPDEFKLFSGLLEEE